MIDITIMYFNYIFKNYIIQVDRMVNMALEEKIKFIKDDKGRQK